MFIIHWTGPAVKMLPRKSFHRMQFIRGFPRGPLETVPSPWVEQLRLNAYTSLDMIDKSFGA